MRRVMFVVLALALAAPAAHAAKESRPTSVDVAELRGASSLALSPDGARVAWVFTSTTYDAAATPKPGDTKAGWKVERQL
jgi:hypothetical protein